MENQHQTLAAELEALREAEGRVARSIASLLQDAGLVLVEAPRKEGSEWLLRVAAAGAQAEVAADRVLASPVAAPAPVDALPALEDVPAAPARRDPVLDAEPIVAREGEDFLQMIGRESDDLVVTPPGPDAGGFALPLLEDAERVRIRAVTMVGDVFLNLKEEKHRPDSPAAVEAVRETREKFATEADVAIFDEALAVHAHPAFPGLG